MENQSQSTSHITNFRWEIEWYDGKLPLKKYSGDDWNIHHECDNKVIQIQIFIDNECLYTTRGSDFWSIYQTDTDFVVAQWTLKTQPWFEGYPGHELHIPIDGSEHKIKMLNEYPKIPANSFIRAGIMIPNNEAKELGLI